MSDTTTTPSEQGPDTKAGPGVVTAGAWLREAREKQALQIAAVAAMLKVPQAKLEALEADRWQDLTDMTFVRALAKAVCRTLKLDATEVLALLPRGGERELDVSKGINTPFRERGGRDEGLSLSLLQRPLVWGPVLMLLAAAAVYWLPNNLLAPSPVSSVAVGPAALPASEAPVEAAASDAVTAEPLAQAASAVPVPAPAPMAAVPVVAAAASAVVAAAAPAPKPVAAATETASTPAPVGDVLPVKIHIKTESWISVTDARGQVLISKLVQPGEDPELVGQLPLKVTIGNVAGTELSLRGSRIDLAARSKDNVARIELN